MMKKSILFFLLLSASIGCHSQVVWNHRYQQYIDQYKDVAIEQMRRWKVPASITLAQGILESGAGQSELARKGNNHFGIKCHGWSGTSVYHDDDNKNDCFRAYPSAFDSFEDHSRFLASGQRYRDLFRLKLTDYKGWARGLKSAGYATSSTYATRLIEIIQCYKLYEYDNTKEYDKYIANHTRDHGIGGQPLPGRGHGAVGIIAHIAQRPAQRIHHPVRRAFGPQISRKIQPIPRPPALPHIAAMLHAKNLLIRSGRSPKYTWAKAASVCCLV